MIHFIRSYSRKSYPWRSQSLSAFFVAFFLFLPPTTAQSYDVAASTSSQSIVGRTHLKKLFAPSTSTVFLRSKLQSLCTKSTSCSQIAKWALNDMKAQEQYVLARHKFYRKTKLIVVGAGIHSTIFLSNLIDRSPDLAESVLVLEAGDVVSANFGKGQPFRINSGKPNYFPRNAEPNLFPGAVLSPEDTKYDRENNFFPPAQLLSEIATISLRAQNVDVLFSRRVSDIRENRSGSLKRYTLKTTNGDIFGADTIVFATGLSKAKGNIQNLSSYLAREKAKSYARSPEDNYVPRIELYTDYLARLAHSNAENFGVYNKKIIGIIGSQHGGNVTAETFLGKQPEMAHLGCPSIVPNRIIWWGQKATSGSNFLEIQKPGGGTGTRQLFFERYSLYGIPEAMDSGLIVPVPEKVESVQEVPGKGSIVNWIAQGGVHVSQFVDYLFVASGLESPALEILRNSFGISSATDSKKFLVPTSIRNSSADKAVATQFRDDTGTFHNIFLIGPGTGLSVDEKAVEDSFTGSPESINVLGHLTATFGSALREVLIEQR